MEEMSPRVCARDKAVEEIEKRDGSESAVTSVLASEFDLENGIGRLEDLGDEIGGHADFDFAAGLKDGDPGCDEPATWPELEVKGVGPRLRTLELLGPDGHGRLGPAVLGLLLKESLEGLANEEREYGPYKVGEVCVSLGVGLNSAGKESWKVRAGVPKLFSNSPMTCASSWT